MAPQNSGVAREDNHERNVTRCAGALQVMTLDGGLLESVVPVAAIQSVGFAFNDSAHAFRAFDGKLGAFVRNETGTKGIHAFDKIWENGMREITTSMKPYYKPWKAEFGPTAWDRLESYTGKLA